MSAQWLDAPEAPESQAADPVAPQPPTAPSAPAAPGDVKVSYAYGRGGRVAITDTVEAAVPQVKFVPAPRDPSVRTDLVDSACRDADPEIFFPVSEAHSAAHPARTVCRRCPTDTVTACLKYALTHAVEGVWGATTELERVRLRQKFNIVATPIISSDREVTASTIQSLTDLHGQGARQIADQLGITPRTVVRHRQRIRAEGETA